MGAWEWAIVVLAVVVAALALFTVGLFYVVMEMYRRIGAGSGVMSPNAGLQVGEPAPPLTAPDARTGMAVTVPFTTGRRTLAVFLTPQCSACVKLAQPLNRLTDREAGVQVVVVVEPGKGFDYASGLGPRVRVLWDNGRRLFEAYQVGPVPTAYLINAAGVIEARSLPNTLVDLDDTLDGLLMPQGSDTWVTVDAEEGDGESVSRNGDRPMWSEAAGEEPRRGR
jgi:hypothetical protein